MILCLISLAGVFSNGKIAIAFHPHILWRHQDLQLGIFIALPIGSLALFSAMIIGSLSGQLYPVPVFLAPFY
ncbi:uncharacterized protein GGS22DRAFT_136507 [Annulohypoxylon maeteangense]|uniref:uncharacterized protein n=1 Tax=Annulohypoxylon maeteangense TaxID=1927788 RepID=UPI002008275B|nr:uncharacterized protein GGS22DRAFT_136507 [Annulohypoxylon maeteangense]KAI0884958.1 hypothetical protein GGS22DRAFT_136507 [Annulohypoxylon maeteangense]